MQIEGEHTFFSFSAAAMEFKFAYILALLLVIGSHAELGPEEYWKLVLPNTPMPKAVKERLMSTLLLQPFQKWVDTETQLHYDAKPNIFLYNNGGSTTETHLHYVALPLPFLYSYHGGATTETQLHENSNGAIFFLENNLHLGKMMILHFPKPMNQAKFLPRHMTDLIPFSSKKIPEILNKFSISPDSEDAKAINKTITECEDVGITREKKLCATSLESMVDFSTSILGRDIVAISSVVEKDEKMEYEIVGVNMIMSGKPVVACHRQEYLYAVFFCHMIRNTVAYKVSLVGSDGSRANVVAVCHQDTSEWDPNHLAFHVLKVQPGSAPVCHFVPEDHILWSDKN